MSLRLEMIQAARLAPKVLGESADLVRQFIRDQQNADGGFRDRTGVSDLYYSVFAVDGLTALEPWNAEGDGEIWRRFAGFVTEARDWISLDFVHLCCLARAWAALRSEPAGPLPDFNVELAKRILSFRSRDGGFHPTRSADYGTVYGAFLALGAFQDLRMEMPEPGRLAQSLKTLETSDGGWANERSVKVGGTNATAAATVVMRHLQWPVDSKTGEWLLAQFHPQGGFKAIPGAPMPDLLSTATALHALAGMAFPFESIQEKCLDFIDSLWTNSGSFHGNWTDDHLDVEYTFYGLLALGHLSV